MDRFELDFNTIFRADDATPHADLDVKPPST
jgi:hypothetical protein